MRGNNSILDDVLYLNRSVEYDAAVRWSPEDIKGMTVSEMESLCDELRGILVRTVSSNGGHLSSNLGTVELTVALHKVFTTPIDQIVWDVGHQCYVHKLLTGRAEKFHTLRTEGGISGFPSPSESCHDSFVTGHSSTAISAANGLAKAKALLGEDGYVIAVVGDGAMTGGLSYEGLSNAGRSKDKLIILLNDNGMSISKNVGYVARHLAALRARPRYVRFKGAVSDAIASIPAVGHMLHTRVLKLKTSLKNAMYRHSSYFEEMGYSYIGPLNGHDLNDLIKGLEAAKKVMRPVILHVATVKGKGCDFAERNPDIYHGVSGFDPVTGQTEVSGTSFSSVFGKELLALASEDSRICAITAAMCGGTGLSDFADAFPKRVYDVGIAEGHAVTFAAGLAHNGALPVFAVYSTFLQRSYDQILNDAAITGEHITLAIDRAGINGDDGETHQGIFDVAFLNTIPGLTLYSPSCFADLQINLKQALYDVPGIAAVRYPRGNEPKMPKGYAADYAPFRFFETEGAQTLIITYGRLFSDAMQAQRQLNSCGYAVSVLKLTKVIPLEAECISKSAEYERIIFFEEGIRNGGAGESFGSALVKAGFRKEYNIRALENFVPVCSPKSGLKNAGLNTDGMIDTVKLLCSQGNEA